ncbi:uncharacterized protein Dana_GF21704 [Drosophila ananassae]|uniref:E3 ubiquitin-protein ligase PPP1R11 n=1 Tax=Drosophila ananassae TaxID=7217 RepID=B3N0K6_DROAN|nr:uncharacterized protein LOC6504376 [Drosophila ananassae]EDV38410.1 uncharacterized protein Dana_GF21704 [Drosophila ananassae]
MDQSKAKVTSVEEGGESGGAPKSPTPTRTIRIGATADSQGSSGIGTGVTGILNRPESDSGFSSAESTDSVQRAFGAVVGGGGGGGGAPCVLRLRLSHTQSPPRMPRVTASAPAAISGQEQGQGQTLKLAPARHVAFHEGVIDNEHMNKRKSKCCCIYRKPHPFGESSSSTEDECEHCFGHPEVRQRNRLEKQRKRRRAPDPVDCDCCCGSESSAEDIPAQIEDIDDGISLEVLQIQDVQDMQDSQAKDTSKDKDQCEKDESKSQAAWEEELRKD